MIVTKTWYRGCSAGGHDRLVDALDYEVLPVTVFYTRQHAPQGLGDAIRYAEDFVGNEPFVVALGDTIITSGKREVVSRLIDSFERNKASAAIAVEKVRAGGCLQVRHRHPRDRQATTSPSPTWSRSRRLARRRRLWPLPPATSLAPSCSRRSRATLPDRKGEVQLVDAIKVLMSRGQGVRGLVLGPGEKRYDIGNFESYFQAFIDFALADEQVGYTVRQHINRLVMETSSWRPGNGDQMKIRASAPGRCGIVGNPTDMYGGSVLSCCVPRRATVTIEDARRTDPGHVRAGAAIAAAAMTLSATATSSTCPRWRCATCT